MESFSVVPTIINPDVLISERCPRGGLDFKLFRSSVLKKMLDDDLNNIYQTTLHAVIHFPT